jgi:hypothetical protein
MLRSIIRSAASGGAHDDVLSLLDPAAVPPALWPELAAMLLDAMDQRGAKMEAESAAAVEMLLYAAERNGDIEIFWPLANRLACSVESEARKPLLYFAGSPIDDEGSLDRKHERMTRREALFSVLIAHEDGPNLDLVVWKLFQSSPERPDALSHLAGLCHRLGASRVMRAAKTHSAIGLRSGDLLARLQAATARLR